MSRQGFDFRGRPLPSGGSSERSLIGYLIAERTLARHGYLAKTRWKPARCDCGSWDSRGDSYSAHLARALEDAGALIRLSRRGAEGTS